MEVAGLALGVAGVAGLFSTCIESFDIVVAGKNFSEDYEQLCALVSFSVGFQVASYLICLGLCADSCLPSSHCSVPDLDCGESP